MEPQLNILEDGVVSWVTPAGPYELVITATNCREERSGYHARIMVGIGDYSQDTDTAGYGTTVRTLEYDDISVVDLSQRVRLANAAYKKIQNDSNVSDILTDTEIKTRLGTFCLLLEPTLSQHLEGEWRTGQNAPPIEFMLRPYVLQGGGTILYGVQGKGKSWMAIAMALSIQHGIDQYWATEKRNTLLVNLERSKESVDRRLNRYQKIFGITDEEWGLHILTAKGRSLASIVPAIRNTIRKYNIECVVLDSISRSGYGSMSEDYVANRIIDTLHSLCPTWIAIGHVSKANEESIYGSVMFEAGADLMLQLTSTPTASDGMLVKLQVYKGNDIKKPLPAYYTLAFDDDGLSDLRHASEMERDEAAYEIGDAIDQIRIFLKTQPNGEAYQDEIATGTSLHKSTISQALKKKMFVQTRVVGTRKFYALAAPDYMDMDSGATIPF